LHSGNQEEKKQEKSDFFNKNLVDFFRVFLEVLPEPEIMKSSIQLKIKESFYV
jgi:hypothetical protein